MGLREFVELAGDATEVTGIALMLGAMMAAGVRAMAAAPGRYRRLRHDLGRAIVLGLEVLVAADIIRTVAFTPTMASLGALALIVAIRTFLSWSLSLELEGRWPWQRPADPAKVS